jgi:hypothetical protein
MEEWVSEWVTLPKEVKEKLSVKNGDYLQYLLIKNGMSIIEGWCRGCNKTGGGKEAIISAQLTAPLTVWLIL